MLPPACPDTFPADAAELEDEGPEVAEAERREAVVDAASHGLRLDKLLVGLAGEFSRSHLQSLIEQGCVQLDGKPATTASRKVQLGQRVQVELRPTPQSQAFRAERLALDIVFEDAHLMVVRKPAGLVVHPAAGHWSGTLLNGLLAHHPGAAGLPRAGIVHRLDKDTSGLMVVGKTLEAVTALVRAIAAREVRREYAALVHGEILQPARLASIDAPIGRDPQSRVRMAVVASGKPARTDVSLVATGQGCSAVRCRLHTGRTHQIRVHLASRGFPLVADAVYGGRPALGLQRQALHAARLGLLHPVTAAPLSFEAEPPEDFAAAWEQVAGTRDLM
ncbi:RluA family pseudouridine synthase [Eleftheria terrae]|uniref:RluA family pseudouridine synthase n=1 Tax=Eleftheria terrae TaxID=1597781 RepID=UPI00263AA727|nr:RluA family pseudouridine synthase [Eleftheria terrae]WKB53689.1 RluA family pseudouridine synthase [Eleftheria terrae]